MGRRQWGKRPGEWGRDRGGERRERQETGRAMGPRMVRGENGNGRGGGRIVGEEERGGGERGARGSNMRNEERGCRERGVRVKEDG